jgi:hypothetical protein
MHLPFSIVNLPRLEWKIYTKNKFKTRPKQLLGYLLLDIALPGLVQYFACEARSLTSEWGSVSSSTLAGSVSTHKHWTRL